MTDLRKGYLIGGFVATTVGLGGLVLFVSGVHLSWMAVSTVPFFVLGGPAALVYWVGARRRLRVERRLVETGRPGRARLRAARRLSPLNSGPAVRRCDLTVEPEGGEPYEGWVKIEIPFDDVSSLEEGASFDVRIDPDNPMRMVGPWPGDWGGHVWTLRSPVHRG